MDINIPRPPVAVDGVTITGDGTPGNPLVAVVGGGTVESVTGYSVDNTDPINPVVKAIPTAGTNAAEPVTGTVEWEGSIGALAYPLIQQTDTDTEATWEMLRLEGGAFVLRQTNSTGDYIDVTWDNASNLQVIKKDSSDVVIWAYQFIGSELELQNVATVGTIKPRFWTKAGIWDVNDDDTQGYLVKSLLFDTVNEVWYICTDNTTGAAVWEVHGPSGGAYIPLAGTDVGAPVTGSVEFEGDGIKEIYQNHTSGKSNSLTMADGYIQIYSQHSGTVFSNVRSDGDEAYSEVETADSEAKYLANQNVSEISFNKSSNVRKFSVARNSYSDSGTYPVITVVNAVRHNYEGAAAPTVNDDSTKGYGVNSTWIYSDNVYVCTDATATAAVWRKLVNDTQAFFIITSQFNSTTVAASTTTYFGIDIGTASTTENTRQTPMPACHVQDLRIQTGSTQNAGGSLVITIRKNGVDTAAVLTIAAGSAAGVYSITDQNIAFANNDLLSLKATNNYAGGISAAIRGVSLKVTH